MELKAGTRWGAGLAAGVAAIALAAAPATGDGGAAEKRGVCFEETRNDLGADYVYSLKARNLSCDRATKLVEEWHKCRHQNGGANGKCNNFSGFSCNQRKLDSSQTLYQGKGKCVKGSQKFVNTFGELR